MITRIYNYFVAKDLDKYKNLVNGLIFLPWQECTANYYIKTAINSKGQKCRAGLSFIGDCWEGAFLNNQFSTKEEAMAEIDAILVEWGAITVTEKIANML